LISLALPLLRNWRMPYAFPPRAHHGKAFGMADHAGNRRGLCSGLAATGHAFWEIER
jgi:hypothetical protein